VLVSPCERGETPLGLGGGCSSVVDAAAVVAVTLRARCLRCPLEAVEALRQSQLRAMWLAVALASVFAVVLIGARVGEDSSAGQTCPLDGRSLATPELLGRDASDTRGAVLGSD